MRQADDLPTTLQAIVEACRVSLPSFEHVGISTQRRNGRPETLATTSDLVQELDDLQYDLDEGPCVDAIRGKPIVPVPHMRHEQRWPRYVPEAVRRTGLRSQLALHLFLNQEGTVGGLNLYSTLSDDIVDDDIGLGELFATHAALALGHARDVENLNRAIEHRTKIGQAVGVLMERFGMEEHAAFAYLARTSSDTNVKLRDVAMRIVEEVNPARSRD